MWILQKFQLCMEYLVKYFHGQKLYIYIIFKLHDARKGPFYSQSSNLHITWCYWVSHDPSWSNNYSFAIKISHELLTLYNIRFPDDLSLAEKNIYIIIHCWSTQNSKLNSLCFSFRCSFRGEKLSWCNTLS